MVKQKIFPIGLDVTDDAMTMVQLAKQDSSIRLIAWADAKFPQNIKVGSGQWYQWMKDSVAELKASAPFTNRTATVTMPPNQTQIFQININRVKNLTKDDIYRKVIQYSDFDPDRYILDYSITEDDNLLIMAAKRCDTAKYLDIYDKLRLQVNSIIFWPTAMINCYINFLARRKSDQSKLVTLLDIESNRTNIVLCRHKQLLYAFSINIGSRQLNCMKNKCHEFTDIFQNQIDLFRKAYPAARINSILFHSAQSVSSAFLGQLTRKTKIPLQLTDCPDCILDQDLDFEGYPNENQLSWIKACGLSLM